MLDLEGLDFDGEGGLLGRLSEIPDHRKRRGIRHPLTSMLAIATAATLAGARHAATIGEHAADLPQEVLRRLGAAHHPLRCRYIAPHEEAFRRTLDAVNAAALDQVVRGWLFDQVQAGRLSFEQLVIALDGKSLRGSLREDGRAVHLFAAMVHGAGIVIGQEEMDEKSNEITALRPLLEPLDLAGALVTADALHCQVDHARFLVEENGLHRLPGERPRRSSAALNWIGSSGAGSSPAWSGSACASGLLGRSHVVGAVGTSGTGRQLLPGTKMVLCLPMLPSATVRRGVRRCSRRPHRPHPRGDRCSRASPTSLCWCSGR